jgi:tripartite-type tricarboxylate transporter receptor subunit TctC
MSRQDSRSLVLSRRSLVGFGVATCLAPGIAFAEKYPSRPIRIIVGFVPGGSTDFGARLIGTGLSDALGVPVVVENKPGATGVLATDYVSKSAGDGYTLLVGTPTPIIVAPQAMQTHTFNPITDLAPINLVSTSPMAFAANPKLGLKRIKDLIALARTRQVTIGTSGFGGSLHLMIEALIQATNANILVVPYKGTGPTVTDAMAGHIDATVSDVGAFIPYHTDGKLTIIGVSSEKRLPLLPDVPTVSEDVPGLVMGNWLGVFASAKVPKADIDTINAALQKVVAREDLRSQFVKSGFTVSSMASPEVFRKFVVAEYQRYGKLIKERNIVLKE